MSEKLKIHLEGHSGSSLELPFVLASTHKKGDPQKGHVHLIVMVPPKVSISEIDGATEGSLNDTELLTIQRVTKKRCWGNFFWALGYYVYTVGLDAETIRRYVRYQEEPRKRYRATATQRLTRSDVEQRPRQGLL